MTKRNVNMQYEFEYLIPYLHVIRYQKKELRNETARGSTAGFGGTGVCVGVRFVSLPSRRARGFHGDEW